MKNSQTIITDLKKRGYRITEARQQIIECLDDWKHTHTIDEIKKHLMTKFKKAVNVKSLYNTLETLIKVGAVQQFVDNRTINYELTINNSFHLHVIDQDSQKHSIIDDPDLVKDIVSLISKKHKLTLKSWKIELMVEK